MFVTIADQFLKSFEFSLKNSFSLISDQILLAAAV